MKNTSIVLVYVLIINHIDAPDLLKLIVFNVLYRMLQNTQLLKHRLYRTNNSYNEPTANSSRLFKDVTKLFDFNLSANFIIQRTQ